MNGAEVLDEENDDYSYFDSFVAVIGILASTAP